MQNGLASINGPWRMTAKDIRDAAISDAKLDPRINGFGIYKPVLTPPQKVEKGWLKDHNKGFKML